VLALAAGSAAACTYARNVQPERWAEWAAALFSGEVTGVQVVEERSRPVEVIALRVLETFKGPQGESATLRMPERVRVACGLALPRAGERLLVGLDAEGNTAWVPLEPGYLEALRKK
jgi:hypothetical protein